MVNLCNFYLTHEKILLIFDNYFGDNFLNILVSNFSVLNSLTSFFSSACLHFFKSEHDPTHIFFSKLTNDYYFYIVSKNSKGFFAVNAVNDCLEVCCLILTICLWNFEETDFTKVRQFDLTVHSFLIKYSLLIKSSPLNSACVFNQRYYSKPTWFL